MPPTLTPIDQALEAILARLTCISPVSACNTSDALGCVLATDLVAGIDVPDYDNSAMDGYAVAFADLSAELDLPVSQTIAAGHPGTALAPGTVARIFTGAMIPPGADTVVIQENTRREGAGLHVLELPKPGDNIRLRGHDISRGSTVLHAGHRLKPQDLGLMSSLGLTSLQVRAPLKVALINTGDEVVSPGTPLGPGQLYDSNSHTLEGLLRALGHTVLRFGIVEDSLEATRELLVKAAAEADCLITTGGVSVGDEDHVRAAVESLGEIDLWKLAIKPGKPFSFGWVNGKAFFGLPGNPVAVFVTFTQIVRACLLKLQGATRLNPPSFFLPADFEVARKGSRREYLRVRVVETGHGQRLEAFAQQGSSIVTSLSWASGLAAIPIDTVVKRGDLLEYFPFEGLL